MDKEKFSLLSNIKYPEDLRKLSIDELPELCRELREDIIEEVAVNPGHFASSLGVVEITVALHYIYNTPYDRIVWDVGHQAYGHKTGSSQGSQNALFAHVVSFLHVIEHRWQHATGTTSRSRNDGSS